MKLNNIGRTLFVCAVTLYVLRILLLVGVAGVDNTLNFKTPVMLEIRNAIAIFGAAGVLCMALSFFVKER